jgi:hypothetical protein
MFSHVFISVSDFDCALRFYEAVMDSLGFELRFCDRERPWAGWHSTNISSAVAPVSPDLVRATRSAAVSHKVYSRFTWFRRLYISR